MKRLLLLTSLIALSAQAMESAFKRLELEDTYEPMEQDQEFSDSEKKFSLSTIMFIYNHRSQLDALTEIITGLDVPAFSKLEKDFKNLSSDIKGEVKELAHDLNVPMRLHPGFPAEVWEMIYKQVFKDRSGWPLVNMLYHKCINENTRTLMGHDDWVYSLIVSGDKIISGSRAKIKIWDMNTGVCEQILEGHDAWVYSLIVAGDEIISGSADKTIKIWDMERLKAIERNLYSLSMRDVASLKIIQDEIIKDEEGQLKEDLCDKDGLNPLQKAKKLGASPALIQWLEQVGCEEQPSARN